MGLSANRIAFVVSAKSNSLRAGKKDASRIHALLVDKDIGHCDPSKTVFHPDIEGRTEFRNAWDSLMTNWNPEDQIVFYFSGHGVLVGERDDFCLLFGDEDIPKNRVIFDHFINEAISSYRLKKGIFIIDSCYSGKTTQIKGSSNKKIKISFSTLPPGYAVITSSSRIEPSFESVDGSSSIFTEVLYQALSTGLGGTPTADGLIYMDELIQFISKAETLIARDQTPMMKISDATEKIWISYNKSGDLLNEAKQGENVVGNEQALSILYINTRPLLRPSGESNHSELDWELIREFASKKEVINTHGLPINGEEQSKKSLLDKLKFYSEVTLEKKEFHVSALICFHNNPERYNRSLETVFVLREHGRRPRPKYVGGNVFKQVEIIMNLIQKALEYTTIDKAGVRVEQSEIDVDLIREVLVNAFVHRNYDNQNPIKVELNNDHLEIQSPGEFPQGVSWDDLIQRRIPSIVLNPTIAYYLKHIGIVEQINQGSLVISDYINKYGGNSVEYEKLEGPYVLIKIKRNRKDKSIVSKEISFPKRLNRIPSPPYDFVGRVSDLSDIKVLLDGKEPLLLLNGLGGIGKTTLVKQFVSRYWSEYDHVLWFTVPPLSENIENKTTIVQVIANEQEVFENLRLGFYPDQEPLNRVNILFKTLNQISGSNLLVIDNAGQDLVDLRSQLPQPPGWQILITSRESLTPFIKYEINELAPEEAEKLFYSLYPAGRKFLEAVKELLLYIGYHTLSVEIFARACQTSPFSLTPEKLLGKLKENDLSSISHRVWTGHGDKVVQIYDYLLGVFELQGLDNWEKSLLCQWAVLPSEEISQELIKQIFSIEESQLEAFEANLMQLVGKGWISFSPGNRTFRIHQMIQEVLRYKLLPTTNNCETLIDGVSKLLYIDQSKDNRIDKFPYVLYGESLLFHLNGEDELITLRNNLAFVYKGLGRYREAATLYEKVLQLKEEYTVASLRFKAATTSNLALVYKELGEYEEAADLLEQALQIDLKNLEPGHPDLAIRKSSLASVYQVLNRHEEAITLSKQALKADLFNFGENHPNVARRRSTLAIIYQGIGRYQEATQLLELALQSDLKNFEDSHPNLATRRSNLANSYQSLGRFEEAMDLHQLALQSDIQNFGDNHPEVAIKRINLALVYIAIGQYEEAVSLLLMAIESDTKNFGEQHATVGVNKNHLGSTYLALGEKEKAGELFKSSYDIFFKTFGPKHPNTLLVQKRLKSVS